MSKPKFEYLPKIPSEMNSCHPFYPKKELYFFAASLIKMVTDTLHTLKISNLNLTIMVVKIPNQEKASLIYSLFPHKKSKICAYTRQPSFVI